MGEWTDKYVTVGALQKSAPDERDYQYEHVVGAPKPPPSAKVPFQTPVREQKRSDCMIFAACRIFENELRLAGINADLSEQFLSDLYLHLTNQVGQDVGSDPRTVMEAVVKYGVVMERELPYSGKYDENVTDALLSVAASLRSVEYVKAANLGAIKEFIAQGRKVLACYELRENFNHIGPDGLMPVPVGPSIGGHAMTYGAYDESWGSGAGAFVTDDGEGGEENQWTEQFGKNGKIIVPFAIHNMDESQGGCWKGECWTFRGIFNQRKFASSAPELGAPPTHMHAGRDGDAVDAIIAWADPNIFPRLLMLGLGAGESNLDSYAWGDRTIGGSYGIFQIYLAAHGGAPSDWTGAAGTTRAMNEMGSRWANAYIAVGGLRAWNADHFGILSRFWPLAQGSIQPTNSQVTNALALAQEVLDDYVKVHESGPVIPVPPPEPEPVPTVSKAVLESVVAGLLDLETRAAVQRQQVQAELDKLS